MRHIQASFNPLTIHRCTINSDKGHTWGYPRGLPNPNPARAYCQNCPVVVIREDGNWFIDRVIIEEWP